MQSRNQYLKELRVEYLANKSKKKRGELLNEAVKRTKLNRKYLIDKLKSKSNLDRTKQPNRKKPAYYDNAVKPTLVKLWNIFDHPCGQRLEPLLKSETEKLHGSFEGASGRKSSLGDPIRKIRLFFGW